METQNHIGSKNVKVRCKILDDFLSYRGDKHLNADLLSGLLSDSLGKRETLDLDFKSPNDDVSSEASAESSPKIISEKHEEESLDDDYAQSNDSMPTEMHGDGFEKNDTPKSEIVKDVDTKDHIQTLERIAKILEFNSESTRIRESGKNEIWKAMSIPVTEYHQNSYLVFFLLLVFFIVFSILKVTFYTLDFLKKYFEKGLILNWSWMKKHFSISKTEADRNWFSFLIISPILIIFLISYTGLYILLLLNKIVLDSVPDAMYQKIRRKQWFQRLWTKNG